MTWLTNWNRRKLITVNGSTTGALSDYQMKLTVNQASGTDSTGIVNLGGNILSNFNDLRFTKSDGTTLLNYWTESITGTTPNQTATVWIKLASSPDTIPVSPGIYNFYIYYNNPGASAVSNGNNTFAFFDDFEDGSISDWTNEVSPYWSISSNGANNSSYCIVGNGDNGVIRKASTFAYGVAWEWDHKILAGIGTAVGFAYNSESSNYSILINPNASQFDIYRNYPTGQALILKSTCVADSNWHKVKITRSIAGIFELFLDGVSKGTVTDNIVTTSTYFRLRQGTTTAAYVDNPRIHKYASPEPTFSATGTEEIGAITPAATGGTVTTTVTHRIHTFTSSGTFVANKAMNVEYLVVAGGGGGGGEVSSATIGAGGGGAGGLLTNIGGAGLAVTTQSYIITVGNGGAGGAINSVGISGSNSSFGSLITSTGGGGGGLDGVVGLNGGSGGGGGRITMTAGIGISGQGYNGGAGGSGATNSGGGGGGAGAIGGANGGNGGVGLSNSISGVATYYAGGGGAGKTGTGGLGGGGNGGSNNDGYAATSNIGGGGGGAGVSNNGKAGGAGGSGIVIIRYLLSEDLIPANITATTMTITPTETPCRVGLCTVNVSVTWTNNGGSTGSFVPNITIGSNPITPIYPLQSLANGANVTKEFVITDLPAGSHPICPDPN